MKYRNIDWFYKLRSPNQAHSIFNLPEYVETYYSLFSDYFPGANEFEKRMRLLVYLVEFGDQIEAFKDVSSDPYIVDILSQTVDKEIKNFSENLKFSNFHWYYYYFNQEQLSKVGLVFDPDKPVALYLWYYTWGMIGIRGQYLKRHLTDLLKSSKKFILPEFEISVLFELLIFNNLSLKDGHQHLSQEQLTAAVGQIIFQYSHAPHSISQRQAEQLVKGRKPTAFFQRLYYLFSLESPSQENINFSEIDISPDLKALLQATE